MDVLSIESVSNVIRPVLTAHGARRAILFGSVAKGLATEHSDVDLIIDSDLRGFAFYGMCADIEEAIGRKTDIFSLSSIISGSEIEAEIARTGVMIFEQ